MEVVTMWGSPWTRESGLRVFSGMVYYETRAIRMAFRRKYHAGKYGLPGVGVGEDVVLPDDGAGAVEGTEDADP